MIYYLSSTGFSAYPCFGFADMEARGIVDKGIHIVPQTDVETSTKWMDLFKPLSINWEFSKVGVTPTIWFKPRFGHRAYLIVVGNLIKTLAEHPWLAEEHLADPGDEPFFDKNYRVYLNSPHRRMYWALHGWWGKEEGPYPYRLHTIEELDSYIHQKKLGYPVWKQCLHLT
jgi:hypothetical protein